MASLIDYGWRYSPVCGRLKKDFDAKQQRQRRRRKPRPRKKLRKRSERTKPPPRNSRPQNMHARQRLREYVARCVCAFLFELVTYLCTHFGDSARVGREK